VKAFGPDPDQPLVPEFGLAEVEYPYVQADLDEAESTIRRYDRNDDGHIDRAEAARSRWTHRDPFESDLNQDDRLSRLELAQRYAQRRLLSDVSDELRQKARRTGSGVRPSRPDDRDRPDDSRWFRRRGSGSWLTASVLGRFDSNKNGRLELQETKNLGIPSGQIDIDRDGELSRDELHDYLIEMQDEAGDPASGLPGWFYERDADGDGQVAMAEFAAEWTNEKLAEFVSLDGNGDGLLTSLELAGSKAMVGGTYFSQNAELLPPGKTIVSEIEISEDFLIADLNVQLSITHANTSHLDAFLTGPDGERIELFTEVGDRGDHFDETVFDDQSESPITKARPPFEGTFMPEALVKKQTSLSHFNDKSVQGVWQLVVRGTRSGRFGMLHGWGLIVRPREDMLSRP
jgi:subtilisin-like proprotein convertase family protein/Ca2+-binding EF-hand superfamily protein